jgi:glyoxylase-like metal-dependent hydrolase (beta-lactamase superfamily II)
MRFGTLDEVRYGTVEEVGPGIRRVVAENPSKFTYRGTGTYIVGRGAAAVIDPGPTLTSHRDALAAALAGERVVAIAVTHCHSDHSPLAAWLASETGAPTVAFGPHLTPPEPDLDDDDLVADDGEIAEGVKVEETIDRAFVPDVAVRDGDVAATGGTGADRWTLRAVHTPGHTANHTCFAYEEESVLFSGDHVMGWSTTVISPPDGDMTAYFESLRKVGGRGDARFWPTHGPAIEQPGAYVGALIEHRLQRERQVLDAVRGGLGQIDGIVASLYADVDEKLHKAAGRSVLAHLRKLVADGAVVTAGGGVAGLRSEYAAT